MRRLAVVACPRLMIPSTELDRDPTEDVIDLPAGATFAEVMVRCYGIVTGEPRPPLSSAPPPSPSVCIGRRHGDAGHPHPAISRLIVAGPGPSRPRRRALPTS